MMERRTFLKALAALPLVSALPPMSGLVASPSAGETETFRRLRPGEAGWPDPADWSTLSDSVGGRLRKVESPFVECANAPAGAACTDLFESLGNPFFIGDNVALTQTLGWTDAWTSQPSVYAVLAQSSADVAAAVKFARRHRLRLVVKGGGHSYLGGSNAPDSLLIWTRDMRAIELVDRFVPQGGQGRVAPEPAVRVDTGARWLEAYDAVTTRAGRYVQGGGCTTVGVAGLVLGGGFGSFSKGFGSGAANLLEAEVVTADGAVRIANAFTNPDLFWALKGGGGGSFGVVTRLTLRTHELPAYFGEVRANISAGSDAAYRALVQHMVAFYRASLMNPHWGEQISFQGRQLSVSMVFQGLDQGQAKQIWAPFFDWVSARPADYTLSDQAVLAVPARDFWNPAVLGSVPGIIHGDDRPGAPKSNFFWANNADEAGQVLHSYQSTWLSQQLVAPRHQPALVDALVRASQSWQVTLHCNKGLAGAPAHVLTWTADTAMNPAVLDAFALAIAAANEPPAYPRVAGHEPNVAQGRNEARLVNAAMALLKALAPQPGSYVSETDYFQTNWQTAFWGDNYARLKKVKDRYDPDGLFFVHHGVGSEAWSADGFTRIR
jgi:FAD/FMN-containing dehydrogenase